MSSKLLFDTTHTVAGSLRLYVRLSAGSCLQPVPLHAVMSNKQCAPACRVLLLLLTLSTAAAPVTAWFRHRVT